MIRVLLMNYPRQLVTRIVVMDRVDVPDVNLKSVLSLLLAWLVSILQHSSRILIDVM